MFLSRRQGREALAELAPPAVCRSTTHTPVWDTQHTHTHHTARKTRGTRAIADTHPRASWRAAPAGRARARPRPPAPPAPRRRTSTRAAAHPRGERPHRTTRNMKGRRICISQTRTCGPLSHVSFMKPLPLALLAGRGPGPVVRNDWCGRPTTCAHTCRADRAGAPYARDRLAAPHASAPSLSPSSSASSHRSSSIASLISSISAASLPLSSTRSYSEARRHPGRVKDAPARSHAREVASAPRAAAPPRG